MSIEVEGKERHPLGKVTFRVELEAIRRGIIQHVWTEAENMGPMVDRAVADGMLNVQAEIDRVVRQEVERKVRDMVEAAVSDVLYGDGSEEIQKKIRAVIAKRIKDGISY